MERKFTVGLATHCDSDRTWMTVQWLRSLHGSRLAEIVVIDNSPVGHPDQVELQTRASGQSHLLSTLTGFVPVKYVSYPEVVGTSASRNLIFEYSKSDYTVCIDSHVGLLPGFFDHLSDWLNSPPGNDFQGLLSGPLIEDSLCSGYSALAPVWSDSMYGRWADTYVTTENKPVVVYATQDGWDIICAKTQEWIDPESLGIPKNFAWKDVKNKLSKPKSAHEIPAHGLGMFIAKTDRWLKFHPAFRGFGGEEYYIHEKYRQAGLPVLSHPELKWWHHFREKSFNDLKNQYPNRMFDRVRNYVIGWRELNLPILGIYNHFVLENRISEAEWKWLISDPVNNKTPVSCIENKTKPPQTSGLKEEVITPDEKRLSVAATAKPTLSTDPKKVCTMPNKTSKTPVLPRTLSGLLSWVLDPVNKQTSRLPIPFLNQTAERIRDTDEVLPGVYNVSQNPLSDVNWLVKGNPLRSVITNPQSEETSKQISALAVNEGKDYKVITGVSGSSPISDIPVDLVVFSDRAAGPNLEKFIRLPLVNKARHLVICNATMYHKVGQGSTNQNILPGVEPQLKSLLADGWFVVDCDYDTTYSAWLSKDEKYRPDKEIMILYPGYGVGTELTDIYSKMGVVSKPGCGCKKYSNYLDLRGVNWCVENYESICVVLKQNAKAWGYDGIGSLFTKAEQIDPDIEPLTIKEKWRAAWNSITTGIIWNIDPLDPIPGTLRIAIKKAQKVIKQIG